MLGLGMGELLLILAIALLVFGPTKLPQLASGLGKAVRSFKKATKNTFWAMSLTSASRTPSRVSAQRTSRKCVSYMALNSASDLRAAARCAAWRAALLTNFGFGAAWRVRDTRARTG